MRILSLADIRFPLPRANGIQTMETAWHLAERGHAVTLFVRADTERPARDPFPFYDLEPIAALTIRRARVVGPPAARRAQYLVGALAQARLGGFDVAFTRDLGVASALLRLPASQRPPVVYESHGYAPVFAESLGERVTGAAAATAGKVARLEAREARVWRRADGYVSTTSVLAGELTSRFGSRSILAVIPNGVRIPSARTLPAAPPSAPPLVAYAGHLYPWKGVDVVLRALVELAGVSGLILGGLASDPDLGRARELAASLGLSHRLTFTGLLPAGEVAARLADASVLVLPTMDTPSARYTSPLKMFEYMSIGRPIVASDLPSIREVLTDGVNARLAPAGDAGALAAAIRGLLDDGATGARLASQAFDDVRAYSWTRRAERLDRVFEAARASFPRTVLNEL